MSDSIRTALTGLDTTNDNHWTADGLPRLETIKLLAGDQTLTRDTVTAAAPGFTRSNAVLPDVAEQIADEAADVLAKQAEQATQQQGAGSAAQQPLAPADQGGNATPLAEGAAGAPQAAEPNTGPVDASQTEQPEMEAGSLDLADEGDEGEESLENLQSQLADVDAWLEKGREARVQLTTRIDAMILEQAKSGPPAHQQNSIGIRDYLASRCKIGEERAATRKLVAESGVDLKALGEKLRGAPIDNAMARKNGRGTARPTRV